MNLADAVDLIRPSIVQISILNKGFREKKIGFGKSVKEAFIDEEPLGTGFIINSDGYVVTARHVVQAGHRIATEKGLPEWWIMVGLAERNTENRRGNFMKVDSTLVDEDERRDLTLLKLNKNPFKGEVSSLFGEQDSLLFGIAKLNPNRPRDGAAVGISGYPFGKPVLVTNAGWMATSWDSELKVITDIPDRPKWYAEYDIGDVYLADVEVNPGNSGAPVYLSESATVIGVCVASLPSPIWDKTKKPQPLFYSSGLTRVVPIRYVIELLEKHNLCWLVER